MRKIQPNEQRKIMLGMLEFIDGVCRKNNIKYSLIGGSLIGAIRHKGFIPWDDDMDIILTKENYNKLKKILDKETGRYQTLKYGQGGERFSFIKLIDTKTHLQEPTQSALNPYYGVFVDIFCYYPTSNKSNSRQKHYNKIKRIRSLFIRSKIDFANYSLRQNLHFIVRRTISVFIGNRLLNNYCQRVFNQYIDEETDYLISSWPAYGYAKEVQLRKNTEEYIDAKFENLTVMIFKNYDEILKTTFGDYMKLPPESERVPKHNMKVWWRSENE